MELPMRSSPRAAFLVLLLLLAPASPLAAQESRSAFTLSVDATEAPRRILHVRQELHLPEGAVTLRYPKWIPGEHGPTGPVTDLAGLKVTSGGADGSERIPWRRDDVDMYAFHLTVPAGGRAVVITFDFLLPGAADGFSGGASSTAKLAVISWNQVVLYPAGETDRVVEPSLTLPEGWWFGTALPMARQGGNRVFFEPAPISTLVDSPVACGAHFRKVTLSEGSEGTVSIAIVGDSEAAIGIGEEQISQYKRLVAEADALFGARHFRNYTFLLTLSDHVAHFGLEHHESSDNRLGERALLDDATWKIAADLLPHEYTHSWNGKHRRPAGLATPDFEQPMKGELLWVYEGLTEYLGEVLTPRSGLWSNEDYRGHLAAIAARLHVEPGRTWRPLLDTTVAAQLLYNASAAFAAHRRGVDFYDEGELIWLEADVLIRQQTKGEKSLDDFCRAFLGGKGGPPSVVPYGFDDVVAVMNAVSPYDWKEFFTTRLSSTEPRAPLGGIEAAGWKLAFTDEMTDYFAAAETDAAAANLIYSIGIKLSDDGSIGDVLPDSAAAKAGIGPGMKVIGVNGRRSSTARVREAIRNAKGTDARIELIVESGDFLKTHVLDYHEGERYPRLVRDETKPDLLSLITKPRSAGRR
jgi:predicted metalloprotease with PDZ domain